MAYKKKVGKKSKKEKVTKTKSQTIRQTVNINIPKTVSKKRTSGGRIKNTVKPESSGFILPGPQIVQQPYLPPQEKYMLIEDIKRSLPQLTYQPPPPQMIEDGGYVAKIEKAPTVKEPTFSESSGAENIDFQIQDITPTVPIASMGGKAPTYPRLQAGIEKEPKPIRIRAPPSESKITDTKSKLSQYNFPERIANKGTTARESDIDAIVEMMYNSNTNQNANISAADLQRAYGISSGAVKKRLERITGLKSIRPSKIPTLKEYNLV